jgi:hypothetical protein
MTLTAGRLHPRPGLVGFGFVVVAIYAAELLLVRSRMFPRSPDLAAAVVTLDLVVCVPVFFYLMVVRARRLPAISVVPVFLASLLGAALVLPADHQSVLDLMKYLALPAELLLVGYVGVRVYRGIRSGAFASAGSRTDLVDRLRSTLRDFLPVPAAAGIMAHEIALLYYAFFSWRSRPDVREGELAFSYHQKNGYAAVLLALALGVVVETSAVHLVIRRWSTVLAWAMTAVSLYGVLWLLGHLQAVRLRPILLAPDWLLVRIGLLWSVRVPYHQIAGVVRVGARDVPRPRAKGYLHAVTLGTPQLLLELREPVDVDGPYGYTKGDVRRIGVAVDERDRFAAELATRVAAVS